jgi:hypothetical protein
MHTRVIQSAYRINLKIEYFVSNLSTLEVT